jgi:hypothetical protein
VFSPGTYTSATASASSKAIPASRKRFDPSPIEKTERRSVRIAWPAPTCPMTIAVCVIVVAW